MTSTVSGRTVRIAPGAYQALRDALPLIIWNKRPYKQYVCAALREHPELLVGLDFDETKRAVADSLIDALIAREDRYRDLTLRLMVEVAGHESFPNLEQQQDRDVLVDKAERAVAELRRWTGRYASAVAERERLEAERAGEVRQEEALRRFVDDLSALRERFLALHGMNDRPQERGHLLEELLYDLFTLFDMEPRRPYKLPGEQIDAAVSFDTDDYIVEAKWWKTAIEKSDADAFAEKVRDKGKNALGLLISVNGLSRGARDKFRMRTPFIAVDGLDLMHVLSGAVRLDELLKRKRRYANETGDCYFPAARMLAH
jgi:hypothetical protein